MVSRADPRLQLVFDEALRAIEQQAARRDDLRNRASALIAVASIATAFLGGQALGDGRTFTWSTWSALASFITLIAITAYVLAPRREARYVTSARRLLVEYVEGPEPVGLDVMQRDLALHLEDDYHRNARLISRLTSAVQLACVLLLLEVGAWLIDLEGRW